jgi:hypothetical protein
MASMNGHYDVVNMLLNCGAAIDAKNETSNTALHLAAQNGHEQVAHLLINHGAAVDAKDEHSVTPLHMAVRNGHKEVTYLLLNHGAEVEATDENSNTALHMAVLQGNKELVHYLRFIDAVYVCRKSSTYLNQEAFSDILGGSEQKLASDLHATLIASLSILCIAGCDGLVDILVMAILGVKFEPMQDAPPNATYEDWQIGNRRKCRCKSDSVHRPLSPVAAAKAVGINIWRERHKQIVTRIWDLHEDKLTRNIDARQVIFVTHRWSNDEVEYQDVIKMKQYGYQAN